MTRVAGALLVLTSFVAAPAHAHMGSTKYLGVSFVDGDVHVLAELDPIDVAYQLDVADPEQPDTAALLARSDEIGVWLAREITLRGSAGACTATHRTASFGARDARTDVVRMELAYACPSASGALVLEDASVFAGDPQHESLVRIDGRPAAIVLRRGRQEAEIGEAPSARASTTPWSTVGAAALGVVLVAGVVGALRAGRVRRS